LFNIAFLQQEIKKAELPFYPRQPGHPPPADPQLSVPRLLGVWLSHGFKEKSPQRDNPLPPKALFKNFLENRFHKQLSTGTFHKPSTLNLPQGLLT
jgi:hypothetical protein